MSTAAKIVVGMLVLLVLLPTVIRWLNELLLPFVVIALIVVVARVVWFHTRL